MTLLRPPPSIFPQRARAVPSARVLSAGSSQEDTLDPGGSGGVAQHMVQVLLQALVLLRELLNATRQAQEGAAHFFLTFEAHFLLRWRPGNKETER